jgi:CheY-like chemotaxis protein
VANQAISSPVLVVDDDRESREALRVVLEDEGYTVFEAPNGRSALQRLRSTVQRFVVMLDWWMPEGDGLQVLRAVAADTTLAARHAFILVTAAYDLPYREVQQLSAQMFVTLLRKPFDLRYLLARVAQAATHTASVA